MVPMKDRAEQIEKTAATFGTLAKTLRALSDHDGTAQLIAFGLLYETGLRCMRRDMSENGRDHVVMRYGITPEELEREVQNRANDIHEQAVDGEGTR